MVVVKCQPIIDSSQQDYMSRQYGVFSHHQVNTSAVKQWDCARLRDLSICVQYQQRLDGRFLDQSSDTLDMAGTCMLDIVRDTATQTVGYVQRGPRRNGNDPQIEEHSFKQKELRLATLNSINEETKKELKTK